MSSFIRTIERTLSRTKSRAPHYGGRGKRLGHDNPKDKAKIARLERERRRAARAAATAKAEGQQK